jgi:hypothetical protein
MKDWNSEIRNRRQNDPYLECVTQTCHPQGAFPLSEYFSAIQYGVLNSSSTEAV